MQVFSALTNLRPFPFKKRFNSAGGAAIGTTSSGSFYPGCSVDGAPNEGLEEPPGSSSGAAEPPDAYYYAQSKPSYRAFSLEQALTNKWLKIAVKAAFLVAVAAACKSAPRTRTINDLLDDYGIPLVKYLLEKLKDRGGFFAAKAQAGYRQLTPDSSSLDVTPLTSAQQLNPEPESSAMGIDPNNIRIIPVGEKLDAESLPSDISDLLEVTAQPAGDMDNTGTPGEAAGTEVATMLTHDVAAVLDLAAQLAHQSTL